MHIDFEGKGLGKKNNKYFFSIMPFNILRSCDKKILMQILNVPKGFRDPTLPIQSFASNP